MATLVDALLLEVLKACEQSAPEPLYPAAYAGNSGLDRNLLDEALDHLRLRGLVRFTDWVKGMGQGYTLTSLGTTVLQNPDMLRSAKLQDSPPEFAPRTDQDESPWSRGEAVRDALLNPARPVVTMTLLAINIAIFLMGMVPALANDLKLEPLGSLKPSDVLINKQWWRILTYAFLHGGPLHLAMNMYALYSVGPLLERMWGSVRFLILYLVGAFVGGCGVVLAMPLDTRIPTVGASGALCGLITSLGVWFYLNRKSLPGNLVSSMMNNVLINIVLMAFISTMPHVSWQGHLGGAIGGALVSVPLNLHRFGRGWQKLVGLAGVIAVPVISLFIVLEKTEEKLTEAQKVQRDLYPVFQAADDSTAKVFNEHAAPLLNSWEDAIDNERLAGARKAFQGTQQKLQEALAIFDKAGPYQDPKVDKTVQVARIYLEEWSKFYALFSKTMEQPPPWLQESKRAIYGEMDAIEKARLPLASSTLLYSPYSMKKN